jgi:heme O synthase-like polyprenyltransferase
VSTPAQSIFDLSRFVLMVTGAIFTVVAILLTYAVVKFRKTKANEGREPAQVYGSSQLELAWTVLPVLIVVVLFLAAARVIWMGCRVGDAELRSTRALGHSVPLAVPPFMAIAWMYREDYAQAGYLVLHPGEQSVRFMSWQALVPPLELIPVSLSPAVLGYAGLVYCVVALALSSGYLFMSACLAFRRSNVAARRLLIASIVYLPLVFVLMVLDKI